MKNDSSGIAEEKEKLLRYEILFWKFENNVLTNFLRNVKKSVKHLMEESVTKKVFFFYFYF